MSQLENLKIKHAPIYSLEWEPSEKEIAQAVRALRRVRKSKCTAVVQERKDGRGGFWWGFTDNEGDK